MFNRYLILFFLALFLNGAQAQQVTVLSGQKNVVEWLKSIDWWGEVHYGDELEVPNVMLVGITERWQQYAPTMPVPKKKEIFFRMMLPLVMHANAMVEERRERLRNMSDRLQDGKALDAADRDWMLLASSSLRIDNTLPAQTQIDQLLHKLDVIPPGLVLGQAAYESGYGTSRFAVEGNALFGQWTFGDGGMKPEQQRSTLGKYGVAAFEWPFDSVRSYFINLNSHPAYADFRRLRSELRLKGEPLTSMTLVEGLTSYSELGDKYVNTLKSIIRVNQLDIADDAVLRDEPMSFVMGAADDAAAVALRKQIEDMRASGELSEIIDKMRLD